jgi:hypothetical protein
LIAWNAIRVVCSDDEQYRDRGSRQVIVAEQDRDHARHVVALLAAGQPAAEDQVAELGRVQLRHLGQRRGDHLSDQVVGTDAGQRALERTADRRARGGDDDGLRHDDLPNW